MRKIITALLILCSIGVKAQTIAMESSYGMIGCPVRITTQSKTIQFDFNNDFISANKMVITDSLKVIKALAEYIRLNEKSNQSGMNELWAELNEQRRQKEIYKRAYQQTVKLAKDNITNTLKIINRKK